MTPLPKVFMLAASDRLSSQTVADIFRHGYSRIPVYVKHRHNVVGVILTKDLIFVDENDNLKVRVALCVGAARCGVVWRVCGAACVVWRGVCVMCTCVWHAPLTDPLTRLPCPCPAPPLSFTVSTRCLRLCVSSAGSPCT